MICEKCGKEYDESLTSCPSCSVDAASIGEVDNSNSVLPENQTLGVLAIVFSALFGNCVGLILAIVGLVQYKQPEGKKKCIIALIIFGVWFVLSFIYGFYLGLTGQTM